MKSTEKRTEEQEKALLMFRMRKYRGSVIAGTGFGKSRVGVRAFREVMGLDKRPGLLLVPFDHLKDRFKDEFEKTGNPAKNIEMECYASIDKLDPNAYSIVVCDEIHLGLTDRCMEFYSERKGPMLFLTATDPEDELYKQRMQYLCPVIYRISMDDCVAKGLVAPYHIECIGIELTEEEQEKYKTVSKNFGYWKGKLGFDPFNTAQDVLKRPSNYGKEHMDAALGFFRAIRQRKMLVDHASNKVKVSNDLVSSMPGKKLVFGGDNAFTDVLAAGIPGSGTYHSKINKKLREAALDDFRTGRITTLCSTKALNQGLDVPDASIGIICGLTSKALTMVQRVGRLVRIDPKDPNKTGRVVIVYVKGSQEEKWLRNSLRTLDSSNITWKDDTGTTVNSTADQD
jgi:superfamily II DNA or RNA helicase